MEELGGFAVEHKGLVVLQSEHSLWKWNYVTVI